jgi:hypothetical protein
MYRFSGSNINNDVSMRLHTSNAHNPDILSDVNAETLERTNNVQIVRDHQILNGQCLLSNSIRKTLCKKFPCSITCDFNQSIFKIPSFGILFNITGI